MKSKLSSGIFTAGVNQSFTDRCAAQRQRKDKKSIKKEKFTPRYQEIRKSWFDPCNTPNNFHTFYFFFPPNRNTHSQSHILLSWQQRRMPDSVPDSDQDVTAFTSKWFAREKRRRDSKLKLLITARHVNTADIRESSFSLNSHSASILEHKSNYHKQHRLPRGVTEPEPKLWVSPSPWHLSVWLHP